MSDLSDKTCRVAFAALIHDIGKFAERAKISIPEDTRERNVQEFCPFSREQGRHTHIHAAYTGIAVDAIEKYLPKINNTDTSPFQTDEKDNSIIGAAARHHKPDTYLQQIISTADRLSSAFERADYQNYNEQPEKEDYQCARLIPLFEKLHQPESRTDYAYRYPLQALSPDSIFPAPRKDISKDSATKEYADLWRGFTEDIQKIKHRSDWNLWLDAFDTLYSVYTQHIPSASYQTIPDVSLYDHSKSTAALATALWRYHYETGTETKEALAQDEEKKFLLIQSDMSGIQKFIFDIGRKTRKAAYKILRGRSFFVSLMSECAALKILQALDLPSVSQIMNAAGKFIILAPDTDDVKTKLAAVKDELDAWLLEKFYGEVSIGIATVEACQKDFEQKNFADLQQKISSSLGLAKLRQFDLCRKNAGVRDDFFDKFDKEKGICCFDGRMPAEERVKDSDDYACKVCLDILQTGENLAGKDRISISESPVEDGFSTDIFGYYVGWYPVSNMIRFWDISLPGADGSVFGGAARRYINAYVPRFESAELSADKAKIYEKLKLDPPVKGAIKTFSHLAAEDCTADDAEDTLKVKPAVLCLKGDIDNLGFHLQSGIKNPTFATMSQFSRQINDFFTVWLPYFQQTDARGKNIYTVFAGGDDFYLIGPWLDMLRFIPLLKEKFSEYVCNRPDITFSAGTCMTASGDDAVNMSSMAEASLDKAKSRRDKNGKIVKDAVCCFGETVSFAEYADLLAEAAKLDELSGKYGLSTGFIYGLQDLCAQAESIKSSDNTDFTGAMWRSKLVYRTARFIKDNLKDYSDEERQKITDTVASALGTAIEKYGSKYKIALYTRLYRQREK